MRALLVLIKRQMIDNAIYFAVAAAVSFVLIIALISVVLTEDRTHLSPYAFALMLTVPILFCVGSYPIGVIHTYSDRTSGVAAVLLVLPVARSRILLARLVVGALVILTALGPLVIVGVVLWKLLGPPDWLFHGWIGDTFLGMTLTALGCYGLGLRAGATSETFTGRLRALPLTIVLLLLIVIKGFGWPLLGVLLPYLGASLLLCCKRSLGRLVRTAATGFIVVVFLVIPLFFGRCLCDGLLVSKIDAEAKISPSGLLPAEIENDPNLENHSTASSSVNLWHWDSCILHRLLGLEFWEFRRRFIAGEYLFEDSGIIEYFESRERGKRYIHYIASEPHRPGLLRRVHFDEVEGQIICHRKDTDSWSSDEFSWDWREALTIYAGPEGLAGRVDNRIGRFESPVVYLDPPPARFTPPPTVFVYDKKAHCFFAIDVERRRIRRGPKLAYDSIRPVDIGSAGKSNLFGAGFGSSWDMYKIGLGIAGPGNTRYLPVIDESGRVDLLEPNTLDLQGPAGHLPRPQTPFGLASSRPTDLLDYDVHIVTIEPRADGQHPTAKWARKQYLGLVVGSLSRQGMWTSVAVFDKEGKEIRSAYSKASFFDMPGGPVLVMMKYLFESLHPPVLTLASFFTAYSFGARSTHRALFLMPNSFVALARDRQGNIFWAFLLVLLLMLPALLLAGLLAWRVDRDAARFGLSPNVRRLWLLGTIAFGLAGYITYRLSRPRVTLVTCGNCGQARRPDMDKCHRCASPWHVPELTPPAWRVLDGAGAD